MTHLLIACLALAVQDPADSRARITFEERGVDPEALLHTVCRRMRWTLVWSDGAKAAGKVTLVCDEPAHTFVDALNSALAPSGVQVFAAGAVLKVVSVDEARRKGGGIHVGSDPGAIAPDDTVRTQVIPLKNLNVVDVARELKTILDEASRQWAINTYSNSIVVTEKGAVILRLARILHVLDVQAADPLTIRVFGLRFADATETARALNDIFRKPEPALTGSAGRRLMRMFQRNRRNDAPGGRTLASELVRITVDPRTNSVVASATEENLRTIAETIAQLDTDHPEAVQLRLFPLRYADARQAATLVMEAFAEAAPAPAPSRRGRTISPPPSQRGASRAVKAFADARTNALIVAATEPNLAVAAALVAELDRQTTDLVQVRIFELENAKADAMVAILRDVFRPQLTVTQSVGRTIGRGRLARPGLSPSALPPSQEVELVADARTNSVIVKASEEFLDVAADIVGNLDEDPTEQTSTFVVPLDNANAAEVAKLLQNLLRQQAASGRIR